MLNVYKVDSVTIRYSTGSKIELKIPKYMGLKEERASYGRKKKKAKT